MEASRKIGIYDVVRLLGKGGMSEVYEVTDARLGASHALKLFSYEKDESEVRDRFLREGRLLTGLSHPRVVKVTDLGTDEATGRPYFVMDLVRDASGRARSLADVEPGTVDEETVGRWYDDLREGLAYVHAHGIIHRDLKLQNVLIGPDGHAVLVDFGISKLDPQRDANDPAADAVKTLVKMREGRGLVMGSVGYMAPELEMGVAASRESDFYALGVIVYRLLTGTWCDSRTDIRGTLETYDPVWLRILPLLLHSNPTARKCLSYADERRTAADQREREFEERWLREKSRGHRARHIARYAAVSVVLLAGALLWSVFHAAERLESASVRIRELEAKLAIPGFSDISKRWAVPDAGGRDEFDLARRQAALVDVWVLTHGIFDDLREGNISHAKAVEAMESLVEKASGSSLTLFDVRNGYVPVGDMRLVRAILESAVRELKRRTPSK